MENEVQTAKNDVVEIKVSLAPKAMIQIVLISTIANFAALTCIGIVRFVAAKKVAEQNNNKE